MTINAANLPLETKAPAAYDVIIVGAGFAGLYALYKLRKDGHSVLVYEAGSGVGGVWYWNRYPGARVDVDNLEYSYTFSTELERDWRWSERYSSQPELEAYANHVADRFDLRRDIRFNTRVTAMRFDEHTNRWFVSTNRSDEVVGRYCVMATGCLSIPKNIDLPGIDNFKGRIYRTSLWPEGGVDFAGKRVGEIGTGSSGVQSIPLIAEQAAHLTVFQRTAAFSMPSQNGPTDPAKAKAWFDNRDKHHRQQRQSAFGLVMTEIAPLSAHEVSDHERQRMYEERWQQGGLGIIGTFYDLLTDRKANDTAAEFVREKIRGLIERPEIAKKLLPYGHPIFTKRPCVDIGYYETFNRDNVTLVDLGEEPLETVTESGIRAGGRDHKFDILVLAIGFDAMTGALCNIDIRGRCGVSLKERWREGPGTYLGLAIAGFPNMFLITGPGSPSVLGNMMVAIEENADWISKCITYLGDHQLTTIEATGEAQDAWIDEVDRAAAKTLYPLAKSWYMGDNIAGKKRVFMPYIGGWKRYLDRCDEVAASGYEGFDLSAGHST
jgi:cation diffusion facilitator CzcD-associated flavoprotein CzcO